MNQIHSDSWFILSPFGYCLPSQSSSQWMAYRGQSWLHWVEKLSSAASCPHHRVQNTWKYAGSGTTTQKLFTCTRMVKTCTEKPSPSMWSGQSSWKKPLERVKWPSGSLMWMLLLMGGTTVSSKMVISVMRPSEKWRSQVRMDPSEASMHPRFSIHLRLSIRNILSVSDHFVVQGLVSKFKFMHLVFKRGRV